MASNPKLLRRDGRRGFRRLVYLCALVATLFVAPGAAGLPADDTPPVVVARYFGTLGANGWYTGDVTVNWAISDPDGPILDWDPVGCAPFTLNVDHPGTIRTCWARSAGGKSTVDTKVLKLDKTPPIVSGAASRPPDAAGWYNRALTVAFSGADATSQIASCSPAAQYAGPDNAAASIVGSCSDHAGNVATASVPFKYDTTPPTLFAVSARVGNRSADIAWRKSTDAQVVEVLRAPGRNGQGETAIYRGPATGFRDSGLTVGRRYEYRVIAIDEATNRAERELNLVATGPLLSPAPGAKVTGPTILVWTAVRRASYYNVQLIRNGRRVLSAWPDRPSFRLRRTWLYRGRRHRLRPGVYRWYVWPGFGRISAARYTERPLGSSTFVVSR